MQWYRSTELFATVLSAMTVPAICILLLLQVFGLHYACCFDVPHFLIKICATLHTWYTARYDLLLNFSTRAKTAPDAFMAEYMMFGGGRLSPTIEVRT
jgi:hypothetical protein